MSITQDFNYFDNLLVTFTYNSVIYSATTSAIMKCNRNAINMQSLFRSRRYFESSEMGNDINTASKCKISGLIQNNFNLSIFGVDQINF